MPSSSASGASSSPPSVLTGWIERITFHNPETGFSVLRVNTDRRGEDPAVVVGNLNWVAEGERVEAAGRWVVDRDRGRQFQAESLKTSPPNSPAGVERFLASGAVRGIGPALAKKIVALYGLRTLEILDEHSDLLLHLRGVGKEKLRKIRESWQEQRGVREIMLFLHQYGIGGGRAVAIHRTYGPKAISVIQANPFQLAEDVRGIGFKTADQLAAKLGVDPHSPFRVRAAVRHVLTTLSTEGHVAADEAVVTLRVVELLNVSSELVPPAIEHEIAEERVTRDLVERDAWLYLTPLYRAEVGLAQSVARLANSPAPLPKLDLDAFVAEWSRSTGVELSSGQRDALRLAAESPVVVATGGPGVGKTTLVRAVLDLFDRHGKKCVLAAPTGRAAKRLTETTGRKAATVHRLLEFNPADGGFVRGARRPLDGDLFVLDESSMLDVVLANQFLRAVPTGAAVLLVGDVDQLPSVGPGSVLADLIASDVVPVARLTQIFRQAAGSRIVQAAHAVNEGMLPELAPGKEISDFYFIKAETPEEITDVVLRLVKERIPQRFGFDPRADVQLLAPMNRGPLGARAFNELLQKTLNPPKGGLEAFSDGRTLRVGDRVMQRENNYQRGVFNGDLGVIQSIDPDDQLLTVDFDGTKVEYEFPDLDELALAYATTIHKSQGSEYRCVIVPVHTQHFVMLRRNLFYTALTRGKGLVVLVGSAKALEMAIARTDDQRRGTALRSRLIRAFDEARG